MNKYLKIIGEIILAVIILTGVFSFGIYIGEQRIPAIEKIAGIANKETGKPTDVDFSLFWESWKTIENNFAFKEKINRQSMIYGAISGMIKSLNDPYSVFFNPTESKKFLEDVSGSFEGIGAEIGIKKNQLLVIAPLKDTPADKAGLKSQDRILKIDNKSTIDLNLEEAVSLIRGAKGTEVRLLIDRDGFEKPREFKIIRGVIKVPVLKFENKEGVAVVSIYSFNRELSSEFKAISRQLAQTKSKKMIIDLRNNPGGYLDVAQDIASYFLPWGKIITIEDYGNGQRDYIKSRGYNLFSDFDIVILVNSGSASASEILAGALRDNLGIKLIGEKTFGKGSVQELLDLKDESSIKVTIASWLTPKEIRINDIGLEPDIKVELKDIDVKDQKDIQLNKAIETLSGL